jgi:hypothetical protein
MKVRFTSVVDEFLPPLFFTSQSLHPRVVFLTFSVCVSFEIFQMEENFPNVKDIYLKINRRV